MVACPILLQVSSVLVSSAIRKVRADWGGAGDSRGESRRGIHKIAHSALDMGRELKYVGRLNGPSK